MQNEERKADEQVDFPPTKRMNTVASGEQIVVQVGGGSQSSPVNEGASTSSDRRGEKRKADAQETTDRGFRMKDVKQIHSKNFQTTGTEYVVQFTNRFADLNLIQSHQQIYDMFGELLNDVLHGIRPADRVRFMLPSSQLEYPIAIAFIPRDVLLQKECCLKLNVWFNRIRNFALTKQSW